MDSNKRLLIDTGGVLANSIIGAILMMGADPGGSRWLKVNPYVVFFASVSSPAAFSTSYGCSVMLRLRKRS